MNIPPELRYSTDHEWVRVEGNLVTIGITEFAQDALGDVVFVEIPERGSAVAAGDSFTVGPTRYSRVPVRLMPEQIYATSRSRADAIARLRAAGFVA